MAPTHARPLVLKVSLQWSTKKSRCKLRNFYFTVGKLIWGGFVFSFFFPKGAFRILGTSVRQLGKRPWWFFSMLWWGALLVWCWKTNPNPLSEGFHRAYIDLSLLFPSNWTPDHWFVLYFLYGLVGQPQMAGFLTGPIAFQNIPEYPSLASSSD